jgi:biotin carboxyl carrier protein
VEAARWSATSPAVGYYIANERTPVGRAVAAGDVLGWVEVLGVRQEVVAPRDGVVGRLLAEAGQAVEYGQELLILDPVRRTTDPGGPQDAIPGGVAD